MARSNLTRVYRIRAWRKALWPLAAVMTVVGVVGLAVPASASPVSVRPRVTFDSSSVEAEPGLVAFGSFEYFTPGDNVAITMNINTGHGASGGTVNLGSFPAMTCLGCPSLDGTGELYFRVPALASGMHVVTAMDSETGAVATTRFRVLGTPTGRVTLSADINNPCDQFRPGLGYAVYDTKVDLHGLVPYSVYEMSISENGGSSQPSGTVLVADANGDLTGFPFPMRAEDANPQSSDPADPPGPCWIPGQTTFTVTISNSSESQPTVQLWADRGVTLARPVGSVSEGASVIHVTPTSVAPGKDVHVSGQVAYKGPNVGLRLGSAVITLDPGSIALGTVKTGVLGGINSTVRIPSTVSGGSYTFTVTAGDITTAPLVVAP